MHNLMNVSIEHVSPTMQKFLLDLTEAHQEQQEKLDGIILLHFNNFFTNALTLK